MKKRRFRPIVEAIVGPPIDLDRYREARETEPTRELLREATDTIMIAIRDEVATLRGEAPPDDFYVWQKAMEPAD